MLPADWDGTTPPPGGAPNPFAEWDDSAWIAPNDALRIWNFHVDWTTPANSYFGTAGSPFVPTYTLNTANVDPTLCAASPACIDQPGTTVNLHDLADRLMHRLQYRNFGAYQTLVGNHTVDTNSPAGRAGIHWFELRNSGSAWAINQEGTYGPADTTSTSRWMGSIAMDGAGNMALGYSITDNVSLYPSIRYAGRLASDPPGDPAAERGHPGDGRRLPEQLLQPLGRLQRHAGRPHRRLHLLVHPGIRADQRRLQLVHAHRLLQVPVVRHA